MSAPAKDPRFPWTHVHMDMQTDNWDIFVKALKTCWSTDMQEEVARTCIIRGFESEARCKDLLARQAHMVTAAAKWDKIRSQG